MIGWLVGLVVCGLALGGLVGWLGARRQQRAQLSRGHQEARALVKLARAEMATLRSALELKEREKLYLAQEAWQRESRKEEERLQLREASLAHRASDLDGREEQVTVQESTLAEKEHRVRSMEGQLKRAADARDEIREHGLKTLEALAGESRQEVFQRLTSEYLELARAEAQERIRRIQENSTDQETGREAKRLMDIAIQRYEGHYLTERLLSVIPVSPEALPKIFGADFIHLPLIEEISNVKLNISDDQATIRLEGQDSFGREMARRAIQRFMKQPIRQDARRAIESIKNELEREVFELGKKAFEELQIPRAHADIVRLVGRLNWRTSYTQNQWKHAIEAAFLCGMIAAEMGLDVKLARRAALMHDIGKSLTHALDGSHAVIGADYARRLGESELVANAIGAHHLDEPFQSVYAYLVAATDAMSGARPGARREQSDNHVQKLEDLERIGTQFAGVDRTFAVQGGREVRVYVREDRVSDERAVELSSEIARKISDEMTFPGQIKVTVIREVRAEAIAN